jgi:hypothetical protein
MTGMSRFGAAKSNRNVFSVSGLIPPVCEGRLEMRSWTLERSCQYINGGWNIVQQFSEIHHGCHLLTSTFQTGQARASLSGFIARVGKTKIDRGRQNPLECECRKSGYFPRYYCPFGATVILLANCRIRSSLFSNVDGRAQDRVEMDFWQPDRLSLMEHTRPSQCHCAQQYQSC